MSIGSALISLLMVLLFLFPHCVMAALAVVVKHTVVVLRVEVVEEEDSEEEGEAGEVTEVMEEDTEETNDQVMILMVLLVECDAWRILVMIMATVTEKVMVPAV